MIKLDVLTRPFPQAEVRQRKNDAGRTFDYVEAHSVIARLNEAFQGAWSFRALHHQVIDSEVIVLGELSADGFVKQQFGSATLRPDGPEAMSVGDTFKAAASDALKKCATEFGVALELYGATAYTEAGGEERPAQVAEASAAEDPATDKQRAFLERIVQRDDITSEHRMKVRTALAGDLSKTDASELISLFAKKRAA